MKASLYKTLIPFCILAAFFLLSVNGFSQDRKLPDGTIIYGDGTRKLPNGTIIYKGRTGGQKGTTVRLPDGRVVFPDGSRRYPNDRRDNRGNNGKWLPPGQAKKIYGGRARDYAPGQQKKWKKNDNEWRDDEHEGKHDEHEGKHENHGREKGHDD